MPHIEYPKRGCVNCLFLILGVQGEEGEGQCRERSPGLGKDKWPLVTIETGWCGKHKFSKEVHTQITLVREQAA